MPRTRQTYKIERGIPLPTKVSRYPFAEMTPGDSFFIPVHKGTLRSANNAVRSAWKMHKQKAGLAQYRITCREFDGAQKGIRVWLIPGTEKPRRQTPKKVQGPQG